MEPLKRCTALEVRDAALDPLEGALVEAARGSEGTAVHRVDVLRGALGSGFASSNWPKKWAR